MAHDFPMKFTLESGTEVQVSQTAANTYSFDLIDSDGKSDNFTYIDDNRSRDEVEETLDFDQLNALRAFWLKRDEVV